MSSSGAAGAAGAPSAGMPRGGAQVIPRPESWQPGGLAPWHGRALDRPGLADVAERIARHRPLEVPLEEGMRTSAVLVLLVEGDEGVEVLLTKRAAHLRNHHGEISFPGGRVEPGESVIDAALREAYEEVGIESRQVEVVGRLDPRVARRSMSQVVPVVAISPARPNLVVSHGEVDRAMWVPLAVLTEAERFRAEIWAGNGGREVYFFELDDETMWGMTAGLVHQLLRLAHGLGEPEPAGGR